MLSGIGPAAAPSAVGIGVIRDLPIGQDFRTTT